MCCVCEYFRSKRRSVLYLSTVRSIYTRAGIKDDMCWLFASCALCLLSMWRAAISTMATDTGALWALELVCPSLQQGGHQYCIWSSFDLSKDGADNIAEMCNESELFPPKEIEIQRKPTLWGAASGSSVVVRCNYSVWLSCLWPEENATNLSVTWVLPNTFDKPNEYIRSLLAPRRCVR